MRNILMDVGSRMSPEEMKAAIRNGTYVFKKTKPCSFKHGELRAAIDNLLNRLNRQFPKKCLHL